MAQEVDSSQFLLMERSTNMPWDLNSQQPIMNVIVRLLPQNCNWQGSHVDNVRVFSNSQLVVSQIEGNKI